VGVELHDKTLGIVGSVGVLVAAWLGLRCASPGELFMSDDRAAPA
jgi:hypothetical protein